MRTSKLFGLAFVTLFGGVTGCASPDDGADTSANAFTSSPAAAGQCSELTKALDLQQVNGSLGLTGAINVEDTASKNVVRIFLTQSRHEQKDGIDIHDFEITAIVPVTGGDTSRLFADLDRRTNLQLTDIPMITKGCEVGFNTRRLGPDSVRVRKEVSSVAPNTIVLAASDEDRDLAGELKLTFHGRNMD